MAEDTPGREPVTLVEIDQDQCTLEYGVAPCTAEVGVTGDRKCFNTRATCQDPTNYSLGTLTLRFCEADAEVPFSWGAIPSLQSVNTNPAEINPGGGDKNRSGIGSRAKLSAKFKDHPHSDFKVDKYRDERTYIPIENGTFWTKWLKRNPYHVNRLIRVREGYLDQDPANMQTRTYVIQEIQGPTSQGMVTVKAEDILTLTDIDKAQAPNVTEGELLSGINETDGTITIVNYRFESDYPAPDPTFGYSTIRVSDEVIRYASRSVDSGAGEITLSSLTRGADGTTADSHDAEDTAQICLRYDREDAWEIVRQLLVDYANVPSAYIPFTDWEAEAREWFGSFQISSLITEPEAVDDLISEITTQCLFFIWWDERSQEIKLKALRPPVEGPYIINDYQHIKAGSWNLKVDDDQRISQVWIYYIQRNPTEDLDEPTNFKRLRVRLDGDAETDAQYGEKKVKRIYSRWLVTQAQAINLAAKLLARYRDGAEYLTLELDAKDREIWTGDVVDATLLGQVDDTGEPEERRYQVVSAEEHDPGSSIRYKLLSYEFVGRYAYWMASDAPDFANATTAEKDDSRSAWWSEADGTMPDGTDGYQWQ